MPFLTEVHFQNYRSFLNAKCRLSPVTVVIGANNAGKSNFLRTLLTSVMSADPHGAPNADFSRSITDHPHRSHPFSPTKLIVWTDRQKRESFCNRERLAIGPINGFEGFIIRSPRLFKLNASNIGVAETDQERPSVHEDGESVTRVLKLLKLRYDDIFEQIEIEFRKFVPEVEKLIFEQADQGKHYLEVRESNVKQPIPLSELSEGSRIVLALITIFHQINRPELILLEDIETAIHPRSLRPLVDTIRRISAEHKVQIIMTTQSPYVLDCFQEKEFWGDVVIVEKTDGVSRLTNADERLKALGYDEEKMEKVSLGDVWYSGLLGGVAGPNELWDEPSTESTKP